MTQFTKLSLDTIIYHYYAYCLNLIESHCNNLHYFVSYYFTNSNCYRYTWSIDSCVSCFFLFKKTANQVHVSVSGCNIIFFFLLITVTVTDCDSADWTNLNCNFTSFNFIRQSPLRFKRDFKLNAGWSKTKTKILKQIHLL